MGRKLAAAYVSTFGSEPRCKSYECANRSEPRTALDVTTWAAAAQHGGI